jgi:hypothetical protein
MEDASELSLWHARFASNVGQPSFRRSQSAFVSAAVDSSSYFYNDADDEDFGGDDGMDAGDDGPAFNIDIGGAGEGPIDVKDNYGDDLVAQPKTTNRIQITYAKTAKRVDVKKLKDNIWSSLTQKPDGSTDVSGSESFW